MKTLYQAKNDWYANSLVANKAKPYSLNSVSREDISQASLWHAQWMRQYLLPDTIHDDDLKKICTLQMIHFMRYTEELERLLVSPVLNDVVNGHFDEAICQDMIGIKSAAIRILTDEAYHAAFSFDAHFEMLDKFSLPSLGNIHKTQHILRKIEEGSANDCIFRRMIVAVMSESNVTNDLAKISRSIGPGPFQDMILDHLRDEQHHMLFFDRLFSLFWKAISREKRAYYAKQIPELMLEFYRKDVAWLADNCHFLGVSDSIQTRLMNYRHDNLMEIVRGQAKPFLSLLKRNRVVDSYDFSAFFDTCDISHERK